MTFSQLVAPIENKGPFIQDRIDEFKVIAGEETVIEIGSVADINGDAVTV